MRWGAMVAAAFGVVLLALGVLWFLQGSDVVHMAPVLCVANCEPVVGHQPQWQVAGALAALVGAGVLVASVRRLRR